MMESNWKNQVEVGDVDTIDSIVDAMKQLSAQTFIGFTLGVSEDGYYFLEADYDDNSIIVGMPLSRCTTIRG